MSLDYCTDFCTVAHFSGFWQKMGILWRQWHRRSKKAHIHLLQGVPFQKCEKVFCSCQNHSVNLKILLPLNFYVKSNLAILGTQNLPFRPSLQLRIWQFSEFSNVIFGRKSNSGLPKWPKLQFFSPLKCQI